MCPKLPTRSHMQNGREDKTGDKANVKLCSFELGLGALGGGGPGLAGVGQMANPNLCVLVSA